MVVDRRFVPLLFDTHPASFRTPVAVCPSVPSWCSDRSNFSASAAAVLIVAATALPASPSASPSRPRSKEPPHILLVFKAKAWHRGVRPGRMRAELAGGTRPGVCAPPRARRKGGPPAAAQVHAVRVVLPHRCRSAKGHITGGRTSQGVAAALQQDRSGGVETSRGGAGQVAVQRPTTAKATTVRQGEQARKKRGRHVTHTRSERGGQHDKSRVYFAGKGAKNSALHPCASIQATRGSRAHCSTARWPEQAAARPLVPEAAVLPRPLQHRQVTGGSCFAARPLVPARRGLPAQGGIARVATAGALALCLNMRPGS